MVFSFVWIYYSMRGQENYIFHRCLRASFAVLTKKITPTINIGVRFSLSYYPKKDRTVPPECFTHDFYSILQIVGGKAASSMCMLSAQTK